MTDTETESQTEIIASFGFTPPTGSDTAVEDFQDHGAEPSSQTILVGELHHRLQNTLSIVMALSRLTARTVTTMDEFQVAFGQRIAAMARTNSLLLKGEIQAVSVKAALETELRPYLQDEGQVTLVCEPLKISSEAALSLSLIFHELVTNAVKYGALADPSGRLVIRCQSSPLGAVLYWQETVTRPIAPAHREGSGTLLISRLVRSLGGKSRIDLLPGGLDAEITFRLGDAHV